MSLKPRYSAGTWRRYGLVVRIPGTVNGRARYDHTGELTFAISDRKYTIFYYNTSHIFEWSHSLLQWFGIVNGDVMEKNSSRTIFMYKSQQEHESMWGPLPFISHQEVLL